MRRLWNKIGTSRVLTSFSYFYWGAELDITTVAVAYYLLISFFPILMLFASLLPYIDFNVVQILFFLKQIFPERVYPTVSRLVVTVFTEPSTSWFWVSLFSVFWTIMRSMNALQKAFNKAYAVARHRSMLLSHVMGVVVGISMQIILTFSLTVFTVGDRVIRYLHTHHWLSDEWFATLSNRTQPVVYLAMALGLLLLYYILPNVRITKFRYILPGTFFVIGVLAGLGKFFRYYLDTYAARLMDFRFVTTVVIMLLILWFMFLSNILLIGATLNATYQSLHEEYFITRKGERVPVGKRIQSILHQKELKLSQKEQTRQAKKAKKEADD